MAEGKIFLKENRDRIADPPRDGAGVVAEGPARTSPVMTSRETAFIERAWTSRPTKMVVSSMGALP